MSKLGKGRTVGVRRAEGPEGLGPEGLVLRLDRSEPQASRHAAFYWAAQDRRLRSSAHNPTTLSSTSP